MYEARHLIQNVTHIWTSGAHEILLDPLMPHRLSFVFVSYVVTVFSVVRDDDVPQVGSLSSTSARILYAVLGAQIQ